MPHADRPAAAARRPGFALLPLLTIALLAAASTGCQSGPVPAAEFVAQADRLHDGALASTVTPDRDLNEYFAEVGRRIIDGAGEASGGKFKDPVFAGMQFHLVGSDLPNAYTTGGRHIYVYNGLFQLCRSEEELAAVLAHQFAHAVDLDVQRSGMRPNPNDTPDRVAYAYVANPISPGAEVEADARAFAFYTRGGWDPAKYAAIYERMQQAELARRAASAPGRGAGGPPGPTLASRIANARALARDLPAAAQKWRRPEVADPQTFQELRVRANDAARGERVSPQNRAWLYLRAFPHCFLPTDLPEQQAAQERLRRDVTPVAPPTTIEPS